MANVRKHPSGSGYYVRWRDLHPDPETGRRPQRNRRCPDRATARALARQIESAHALGVEYRQHSAAPGAAAVATAYLERLAVLGRSEGMIAGTRGHLLGFLNHSGVRRLDEISLMKLEAWYAARLEQVTVSTANTGARRVLQFWQYAEGRHEGVPRPPLRLELRSEPQSALTRAPTWAEMDAVIRVARERKMGRNPRGWYADLMTLLRYTGLRPGQAMRLTWEDVDLGNARLTIRGELGKSKQERKGRVVPLSPHLVAWLAERPTREVYLIDAPGDARGSTARAGGRAWELAEVPWEVWHTSGGRGKPFHAFRGGFATGLLEAGVLSGVVEYLCGWAPSRGALQTSYEDRSRTLMRRAAEAIAKVPEIGSAPSPTPPADVP